MTARKMKCHLSAEFIRAILSYDPESGQLWWRRKTPDMFVAKIHSADRACTRWNTRFADKAAGHKQQWPDGRIYVVVRIGCDGLYLASRLAWVITHGRWPEGEIDHRDGDTTNDRIVNLRDATHPENMRNTRIRSDNRSGIKGVSFDPINDKWVVRIRRPGGSYENCGRFSDIQMAADAYKARAKELYGEFARFR